MSGLDLFGLDYTSPIDPAVLHGAGVKFVIRYLSRYDWKAIRRQEFIDLDRAGILVGLVFEDAAVQPLTHAQGKADAEYAFRQASDICGPARNPGAIIPHAFDADPHFRESSSDSYYDGAGEVLGHARTGPYGGATLCDHAGARGFGGIFGTYAWSGGAVSRYARWQQYSNAHLVGGHGVDFDRAFDLASFWNHRYAPHVDPRYRIYLDETFNTGPFSHGRFPRLNERAVVERYDVLRATQTHIRHPHRPELAILRAQCRALADRIAFRANHSPHIAGFGLPVGWSKFNRSERYPGLIARSRGQTVH